MVGSKDDRRDRQSRLVQYILDTLHLHNTYAAGYFFCEALNFINVVSFWISSGIGKECVWKHNQCVTLRSLHYCRNFSNLCNVDYLASKKKVLFALNWGKLWFFMHSISSVITSNGIVCKLPVTPVWSRLSLVMLQYAYTGPLFYLTTISCQFVGSFTMLM